MVIDMKTPSNLLWYDENKNNLNTKLYLLSGKQTNEQKIPLILGL